MPENQAAALFEILLSHTRPPPSHRNINSRFSSTVIVQLSIKTGVTFFKLGDLHSKCYQKYQKVSEYPVMCYLIITMHSVYVTLMLQQVLNTL